MTTGLPSDEELVLAANEILQDADLDQLTHKRVRKKLEERFQADLGSRKEFLKKTVTEIITASGDEGARLVVANPANPIPNPDLGGEGGVEKSKGSVGNGRHSCERWEG
ncbi:unnamed protein product [Discosporangium mesarthrocarpum]